MSEFGAIRKTSARTEYFAFVLRLLINRGENNMQKFVLVAAAIAALSTPALADEVGVHAGPVGAGVSVGQAPDHDRDRDRTVVKEREPDRDRTTVIKKDHDDGTRSKTVIHHDD